MSRLPAPEPPAARTLRLRKGFTLIEAVAGILIVSIMFAAVMQTVGASRMAQYKTSGRRLGCLLGQELMAEILQQYYEEPDDTPDFGRESGESGGDRTDWDDVDDYDGWSATPPESKYGAEMADLVGWSREVEVAWVDPASPTSQLGSESETKLITVTVKHNGTVMAELVAIRTSAMPELER